MAALIIDYKIDKIIKDIQKKITDANGKELSYQTIVKIIETQIECTVNGMAQGHTIVWKLFGTFSASRKRVDALNNKYIREGKTPTLVDTGLVRMSFKRSGQITGQTEIEGSKKVLEDIPEKFK